jgi:hypothetical protein
MRARMAFLLLLAGCFPDADKLRNGSTPGVTPTAGSGGQSATGGAGGTGGAMAGTGGASATGGVGGMPMPTGGMGGVSPARAALCAEYATAISEKASQCSPFTQAFSYGSKEVHAARLRLNCGNFDNVMGVRFPPSPYKPCGDALAALPCADWLDGVTPPACLDSGTVPLGGNCSTHSQCQTDLCDMGAMGCGKCVAQPVAGQPCFRGSCNQGLTCNQAGTCVKPGRAGETCDPMNAPCANSLGCAGGKCAALGAPGTACTSNEQCDVYRGSVCSAMAGKCVSASISMTTCGPKMDGTPVFCGASGLCRMGSCVAAAADGAACSEMNGPDCIWPASCTSAMRCQYFVPNRACPAGAVSPEPLMERELLPAEQGVRALWQGLLPPRSLTKKF